MIFPIVNGEISRSCRKKPLIEMMRVLKYLLVPWIAIAVYSVSSIITGAVGIFAYDELLKERERLQENMAELQLINQELEGSVDALLYDSDTIAVYAKELGYGAEDERFIRIVGLSSTQRHQVTAGTIRIAVRPEFTPDKTLRIIAFSVGLGLFICFVFHDLFSKELTPSDPRRSTRH
jgi:cell division protein FtsB